MLDYYSKINFTDNKIFSPTQLCLKWAGHGVVNTQCWPGEHGVDKVAHLCSLVNSCCPYLKRHSLEITANLHWKKFKDTSQGKIPIVIVDNIADHLIYMHVHCSVLFPIFFLKYFLLYVNFSKKFRDQSPSRCQRFVPIYFVRVYSGIRLI